MKIKLKNTVILLIIMVLFDSCIPLSQFTALKDKNTDCESERSKLIKENEKLLVANNETGARIKNLEKKLAAYKAPKLVEFRNELPKSAVGKILRKVLREEEAAKQEK